MQDDQRLRTRPGVAATRAAGHQGVPQGVAGHHRTVASATPTPARSPSAGRTTSTPTWPPSGAGEIGQPVRQALPDPGRTPTRRSAHHRHARRSTRRRTPLRPAVPRRHVLLARPGPGRPGPRASLVSPSRASPRPARPSCRARRSGARWCPGPPRSGGTPRRSPRRTRSRSTRTTTCTFSAANRIFSSTVRTTSVAPTRPDPGLQHAVPVAGPPDRLGRQPGPVVGDRVVHLVRHGAEPAHAQGGFEDPRRDRVLRVDRGAGSGELHAEPRTAPGRQQAARPSRPHTPRRARPDRRTTSGASRRSTRPATRSATSAARTCKIDATSPIVKKIKPAPHQADLHHLDQASARR